MYLPTNYLSIRNSEITVLEWSNLANIIVIKWPKLISSIMGWTYIMYFYIGCPERDTIQPLLNTQSINMHTLNLITRKHQTNSHWETFWKTENNKKTDLYSSEMLISRNTKKSEKLFQMKGDWTHMQKKQHHIYPFLWNDP